MPKGPERGASAPAGAAERQLAALAEIARIATEDFELRPMLQRITDALALRFGWELVALIRVDAEQERFVCEALTSSIPTLVEPGYSRPFGSGVVGTVAATGRALLLDDAASFPDFVDVGGGIRSELCAPIRHRGAVVGVLNLESPQSGAFSRDVELVEAIADQISGAIASARLYEATRQRALTFEVLSEVSRAAASGADLTTVLHSIATYIQRRFDLHLVAILLADARGKSWLHRAFASREPQPAPQRPRWPITAGVVGRAVRLGTPQLVLDVAADPDYLNVIPNVKAELVTPIRLGGKTLGAINLEHDDPALFSAENQRLLELVADQVAGAIQMALLNEQLATTKRQLEAANRTLERLSHVDPLTGLANRRHFEDALRLEWRRLSRSRSPLSLLLLDVDHFKAYNDAHGHIAGDRCLQRVAQLLMAGAQRAGDLVARYGGEEFAIVLSGTDGASALRIAEGLRASLAALGEPHPSAPSGHLTMSIGLATVVPGGELAPPALVAAADRALYRAKQEGRDRVAVDGLLMP
jgi:diguanylate cyclase (GGDEF)-like protein